MPSRYYKIILPVLVFGAAAVLCFFVGYRTFHEPQTLTSNAPSVTATTTAPATQTSAVFSAATSTIAAAAPVVTHPSTTLSQSPPSIPPGYIRATLSIAGTNFPLAVPTSSTVETAMKLLESQNSSFTFSEQTYQGLGEFVDSINGKANANGYYWFLYVNGKDSNAGASQTIVHPGDVIEWRYMHQ